jgi:hypothetical protein
MRSEYASTNLTGQNVMATKPRRGLKLPDNSISVAETIFLTGMRDTLSIVDNGPVVVIPHCLFMPSARQSSLMSAETATSIFC